MESHLCSKDRRLNQYIHFEMLLYIHTQATTYIYRTSKTNKPNAKMLPAWHFNRTHTSPMLCGAMPQTCPAQTCSAQTCSAPASDTCKAKCENAGKEQLVSYSCLDFFLLKKPLSVEV